MTRIKCYVRKFLDGRFFPFVPVKFRFSRFFGFINALIDTGSPRTVISAGDALRLSLPIKSMKSGEPMGLAGHSFYRHPLKDASLHFSTLEGNPLVVDDIEIGVLVPTKIDRKTLRSETLKAIPSIIGNDLLESYNIYISI